MELTIYVTSKTQISHETDLKLSGHNSNHQQWLLTQKIVALHRYIFNLKFLNILRSLFWINIIIISVSSTSLCVHCSFNIKLFAVVFHEGNYLIDGSYNLRNLGITTSALNRFFKKNSGSELEVLRRHLSLSIVIIFRENSLKNVIVIP